MLGMPNNPGSGLDAREGHALRSPVPHRHHVAHHEGRRAGRATPHHRTRRYSNRGHRIVSVVLHGDDDRNVPFSETIDLVAALRKQGVEFEQLVFPDEVHSFTTYARWLQAYRASADFLERHLVK